jgi:hypothetical protein
MAVLGMLEPKDVVITMGDGSEKTFTIYKFPAIAGREIMAKYTDAKFGDMDNYKFSEDTMLKALCYVSVKTGENDTILNTRALIDNHVKDWTGLMKLEEAVVLYNRGF